MSKKARMHLNLFILEFYFFGVEFRIVIAVCLWWGVFPGITVGRHFAHISIFHSLHVSLRIDRD